jgi:hypothetical protein
LAIRQRVFDRLSGYAVAERMTAVAPTADPEEEILRASLLIRRDIADQFKEAAASIAAMSDGLRCEHSGPWAPYSFAPADNEEA